jgi:hypothetical protein
VSGHRRRLLAAGLVVLAGAALVAVPLGGWDRVDRAAEADRLRPGTEHEGDEFTTRVDRAELLPVRPGSSLDPEPGVAYLAVHARLENMTDRSTNPRSDLVLVGGAGLDDLTSADSVVLLADPGTLPLLQPGLPADVAYVWEVDPAVVAAGDEVRVTVVDRTASESQLGAGVAWVDPRVGATIDLVVEAP